MQDIKIDEKTTIHMYTPKEMYNKLNEYVISQDDAKRSISIAVHNFYKRVFLNMTMKGVHLDKSNILISGNSGCGKTYIVKKLCEFIGVPSYIADSTAYSASGYVGMDTSHMVTSVIEKAGGNLALASIGCLIIDEIDKIAGRGDSPNVSKGGVNTTDVQNSLLKIIEGGEIDLPTQYQNGRQNPQTPCFKFDTSSMMVIGCGAFSGIESIIKGRMNSRHIGFGSNDHYTDVNDYNIFKYAIPEDFKQYGLTPEFISRFAVLCGVNRLSVDDLADILTKPKNSIVYQYQLMFRADNIMLRFDDEAIKTIAYVAHGLGTGARSLKTVMDNVLEDYTFDLCGEYSSKQVQDLMITKKDVEDKLSERYGYYLK